MCNSRECLMKKTIKLIPNYVIILMTIIYKTVETMTCILTIIRGFKQISPPAIIYLFLHEYF